MNFSPDQLELLLEALYTYCIELRQSEKQARRWGWVAFAQFLDQKATDAKKVYRIIEKALEEVS